MVPGAVVGPDSPHISTPRPAMASDALVQAEAIRAGRTTASSVVEESVAVIPALEGRIDALVHPLSDSARRAAARIAAVAEGRRRRPIR